MDRLLLICVVKGEDDVVEFFDNLVIGLADHRSEGIGDVGLSGEEPLDGSVNVNEFDLGDLAGAGDGRGNGEFDGVEGSPLTVVLEFGVLRGGWTVVDVPLDYALSGFLGPLDFSVELAERGEAGYDAGSGDGAVDALGEEILTMALR